jgi:ATP synthase protein I
VINSVAAGRRMAARIVLAQAGITLLVAALFLLYGWRWVSAALCGGASVTLGNALMALRLFATPGAGAGLVLVRLLVGALLKWLVVVAGIYVALVRLQLPSLPIILGVIAALLMQLIGLRLKDQAS